LGQVGQAAIVIKQRAGGRQTFSGIQLEEGCRRVAFNQLDVCQFQIGLAISGIKLDGLLQIGAGPVKLRGILREIKARPRYIGRGKTGGIFNHLIVELKRLGGLP